MALRHIQSGHGERCAARCWSTAPSCGRASRSRSSPRASSRTGGRNNHGRITAAFTRRRAQAALSHRRLQAPQVRRAGDGGAARIRSRTARAFIALVKYQDGELAYILAPQRLRAGDSVVSGERVDIKPGNAMPMENIPVGTIIHNIEMKPGARRPDRALRGHLRAARRQGCRLRAAAAGLGRTAHGAGELHGDDRRGVEPRQQEPEDRQGRPQRAGWACARTVRGVAMNPVDHPHGGGEGTQLGRPPSGLAVGPADQGLQDAQEQAHATR